MQNADKHLHKILGLFSDQEYFAKSTLKLDILFLLGTSVEAKLKKLTGFLFQAHHVIS